MNSEVYWYYVKNKAFGFADSQNINLKDADFEKGDLRLSWKLNGDSGYRCGDSTDLYNS
jgi:hypothetical protein